MHVGTRRGMLESKNTGMKCLTGKNIKTIIYKLLVPRESGALEYSISTVGDIAEEGMPDMAHVGTNLVCATCLEDTLYKGNVAEALKDMPVSDGMFTTLQLLRKSFLVGVYAHDSTILWRTAEVAGNGAGVLFEVTPNEGGILALDGVIEELSRKNSLGLLVLCHQQ